MKLKSHAWEVPVIGAGVCLLAVLLQNAAVIRAEPLSAEAFIGGTGFTYQGQLRRNGSLVNGTCTMVFRLWDQSMGGIARSEALTQSVPIANGLFAVELPFNSGGFLDRPFNGDVRWLDVGADCGSGLASLGRQKLTPAPYAFTLLAGAVISASNETALVLNGTGDNRITVWAESQGYNSNVVHAVAHGGASKAVYGKAEGADGDGVFGVSDAVGGSGSGVEGTSFSVSGAGVLGVGMSISNSGVSARNNFVTGTALHVGTGALRVKDAGLGGKGPVFVHQATGGSICVGRPYATVVDHPLTNGNPYAVLIVTPSYGTVGGAPPYGSRPVAGPAKDIPAVLYDDANWCGYGAGKWVIYTLNAASLVVDSLYNVLVVRP